MDILRESCLLDSWSYAVMLDGLHARLSSLCVINFPGATGKMMSTTIDEFKAANTIKHRIREIQLEMTRRVMKNFGYNK